MNRRIAHHLACLCLALAGGMPAAAQAGLVGTFERLSTVATTFTPGTDFRLFDGTVALEPNDAFVATGIAQGSLQAADDGCQPGDFQDVVGRIALIARGGACTFDVKVNAAADAGAIGAVIFNNDGGLPSVAFLSATALPAVFVTQTLGASLLALAGDEREILRIRVTAIPEPAPLLLLAAGLWAAVRCRRR